MSPVGGANDPVQERKLHFPPRHGETRGGRHVSLCLLKMRASQRTKKGRNHIFSCRRHALSHCRACKSATISIQTRENLERSRLKHHPKMSSRRSVPKNPARGMMPLLSSRTPALVEQHRNRARLDVMSKFRKVTPHEGWCVTVSERRSPRPTAAISTAQLRLCAAGRRGRVREGR